MPKILLTPTLIATEAADDSPRPKDIFWRDDVHAGGCKGLYLKVSASGLVTFGFEYRTAAAKQRRMVVPVAVPGDVKQAAKALTSARAWAGRHQDSDPIAEREITRAKARAERSLTSIWEDYIGAPRGDFKAKRAATQAGERYCWNLYIEPEFGNAEISAITTTQVRNWHRAIKQGSFDKRLRGGPMAAKRAVTMLRAMLQRYLPDEYQNPCSRVKLDRDRQRETILTDEQFADLVAASRALASEADAGGVAILALCLTGARPSEIFNAMRSDIRQTPEGTALVLKIH